MMPETQLLWAILVAWTKSITKMNHVITVMVAVMKRFQMTEVSLRDRRRHRQVT